MVLRALALLATVGVPALSLVVADALPGWLLPALAASLMVPLMIARPRALLSLAIAAGLAALCASTVVDGARLMAVTADRDAWPVYDLSEAPLPDTADGFVVIRGHWRTEWTLDEYRVEDGERPDQNQDAAAVLIPLLGSEDQVIAAQGRIVIARVLATAPRVGAGDHSAEARGELMPLAPGILDGLVALDPRLPEPDLHGVLLDTTRIPTRGQAWTQIALALVTSLLALALAWLATAPREPAPVVYG